MNIFKKLRASLQYREAVEKADNAHRETGERYYVMPTQGTKGQLIVMDRKNFRILKRKGYINNNAKVINLIRECFYCTPYRQEDGKLNQATIELKKKQFYKWMEQISKTKHWLHQ